MDFAEAFSKINYFAVMAAALSAFVIGGIWYSPLLFANAWMKANGFAEGGLKRDRPGLVFSGAFLLAFISSLVLAMFLGPAADLRFGLIAGALVGLGWIATSFGITYLFERKPLKLFFINAGYHLVMLIVMGAILGLWHK